VRSPAHDPTRPFSAVSLMLSFRTMMDMQRAAERHGTIAFRIGADAFTITLADGQVALGRGEPAQPDLLLTGTTAALGAAAYGGAPLAALEAEGALEIEGDRALAEWFMTLFPLPPKAGQ
jgi:hypothetical protein